MQVRRVFAAAACTLAVGSLAPVQAAPSPPAPATPTVPQQAGPAVPVGLVVSATTDRTVTLVWAAQPNVRAYQVQFSTDRAMGGARILRSIGPKVLLGGLAPNHDYFLRVRSVQARTGALSAWTPVIGARTHRPTPPGGLRVAGTTYRSVNLDWADHPGADTYRVELSSLPTMAGATRMAIGPSSAAIHGLAADRRYFVRVRALDQAGSDLGGWTKPLHIKTSPAPAAPKERVLTIASFNVRCALCYSGYNDEKPWTERRDAVVAQVIARRPDVIGFQEASQGRLPGTDTPQFADLRTRLRAAGVRYEITNAHRYNCERSETAVSCQPRDREASQGTRIFYNTDTVELREQGSKLLPSCDEKCNNRYTAWGIFKQKATGKSFFLANVHTQYMTKYADLRTEEVRVMLDEVGERNGDGLPAFIVGDFNSTRYQSPSNAPYDQVIEAGFVDPLGHTPQSAAVSARGSAETRIRANYNSHNNFLRTVAPFAAWENGSNIDYIFATPMRITQWETVVNVDADNKIVGTIPSDHNMIQVKAVLP